MVRQLTTRDYDAFVRERQAAAIHFDCVWDGYHQSLRVKMRQAEQELGNRVNLGEIDCDQNPELARSLHVMNVPTVVY
jgi:thioredoxin-like negative regulator of GroEL